MSDFYFPPLALETWQLTYDTLHHYTRALGALRRAATPRQKHWSHVSLRVNATGLTTTAMPCRGTAFEVALDLATHRVVLSTSYGASAQWRLQGHPLSQFWQELNGAFAAASIEVNATQPDYPDAAPIYNPAHAENYWRALSQVDLLLKQFQGELRQETSHVQFWSHHFDLAMLWLSGRLVPGQDPNDEENADEQMNFGFSVGDEGIKEPYFYITAYPLPNGLVGSPLPSGAYWHTEGWNGAVLLYKQLVDAAESDARLLDFWRTVRKRGAELMK